MRWFVGTMVLLSLALFVLFYYVAQAQQEAKELCEAKGGTLIITRSSGMFCMKKDALLQ